MPEMVKGKTALAKTTVLTTGADVNGGKLPTLLFTKYVKSKRGREVGTLIDNGGTDHYVLNSSAKKLKLRGKPVELFTEGFGGNETTLSTHEYQVPVKDKYGNIYHLPCYGVDVITSDNILPDPERYTAMC